MSQLWCNKLRCLYDDQTEQLVEIKFGIITKLLIVPFVDISRCTIRSVLEVQQVASRQAVSKLRQPLVDPRTSLSNAAWTFSSRQIFLDIAKAHDTCAVLTVLK